MFICASCSKVCLEPPVNKLNPINLCLNNVRGLRLGPKFNIHRPTSNDPLYQFLKSAVTAADITVLVETKVVGHFDDVISPQNALLPKFKHFRPFGDNFHTAMYSCDSIANGIIVFFNNQTVEILDVEYIHSGRLLKLKGQKSATRESFVLFAVYLPSNNNVDGRSEYTELLSLLDLHVTPIIKGDQDVYICGDFNADIYNYERANRVKEKSLAAFVNKHELIDLRIQSDFPTPTFYPADVNKKSGTLDYIFSNKPTKYRNILNTINPSSDHTILSLTNSTKPSQPGSTIFNKLFDNTNFVNQASTKLLELHHEFCLARNLELADPNSPVYLDWLELMIDNLSTLNKQYQITEVRSLRRANNVFNRGISKLVKKLSKGESPQSRAELENLKSQHVNKVSEDLKHSSNYFRTQKTVYGGTNHRSCFSAFQNKRGRQIHTIECPKTNRILTNPLEIAETFADFQKSKVQLYDPTVDMQEAGINLIDNSPLLSVLNKHNVTLADFLPSFDTPPPPKSIQVRSKQPSAHSNVILPQALRDKGKSSSNFCLDSIALFLRMQLTSC